MPLSKQALVVKNNTNFPNNNTGYITPALLREFNTDMIDAMQLTQSMSEYAVLSGSNSFIGNQTITGDLNVTGVISASVLHVQYETASVIFSTGSNQLGDELTDIQTLSGSVKIQGQLLINGIPLSSGSATVDTGSLVTTASFNTYTSSNNQRVTALETNSASVNISISNLNTTTASLNTSITNINAFTASQKTLNGTFATTGSNTFTGNQVIDRASKLYTNGVYWTDMTAGFNNLEIINQGGGNLDFASLNGGRMRVVNTPLQLTGSALSSNSDISTSANVYGANLTASAIPAGTISSSAQISALGFVSSSVTASSLITASFSGNTLTFTKGDASTFGVVIPDVSGSTINTGSLVTTASFNAYTASNDQRVSSLEVNSASVNISINNINTTTASLNSSVSQLNTFTASQLTINSGYNSYTQSNDTKWNTLGGQSGSWITESETASFARTNVDNNFTANQTFTNITAVSASFTYVQTLYETSSVIYSSGSNQFGDELSDIQTLSGSVKVQGSLTVNGTPVLTSSVDISGLTTTASFNAYTQSNDQKVNSLISATGSYATTGSNNFVGNQTITGSLYVSSSTQKDVIIEGQLWISSSNMFASGSTVQPQINISGPLGGTAGGSRSGSASMNAQQVIFNRGTKTSTVGNTIINVADTSIGAAGQSSAIYPGGLDNGTLDGNEIGLTINGDYLGVTNFSGPSIWIADNTLAYKAMFGFQDTTNYTDGRVTVFTPLSASAGFTASLQNGYAWVGNSLGQNTQVATSSFGTAIDTGSFATTGSNTFVGNQIVSGTINTTQDITISGVKFGFGNPAGTSSIAIGTLALANNTGVNNVAIGISAAQLNTNGEANTIIGNNAAVGLTSGSANTIIGYAAGAEVRGGSGNTFIGQTSGYNTSGSNNTFIGAYRGIGNESGVIALSDGGQNLRAIYNNGWAFTGSVDIQNTLTASLAQGFTYVGDANGRTTLVATSSFGSTLPSGLLSSSVTNFVDYSASVDTRINNIVTGTGFATTGSNTFTGNQTISSSAGGGDYIINAAGTNGTVTYGQTGLGNFQIQQSGSTIMRANSPFGFDIFASASFIAAPSIPNITSDLKVNGNFTASLQQGYVWVGDASGVSTTVSTSSFGGGGTINTGSFATTGSNSFNGDQTITGSVRAGTFIVGTIPQAPTIQSLDSGTPEGNTSLQVNAGASGSFSLRTLYGAGVGKAILEAYDTFPSYTKGGKIEALSNGGLNLIGYAGNIQSTAPQISAVNDNGFVVARQGNLQGGVYMNTTSGSLILTPSGFSATSSSLLHLSASSNTNFVNLIFKNNNTAADTIISGSNNLFVNPAAVTAGFKRYIGGSGNIMLNGSNVPQISGSMAFSPTINNNYFGANGGAMNIRGPVSASSYTISGNSLVGGINIGTSATLHAQGMVSSLTITGNQVAGQLNIVANQSAITSSTSITNNSIGGGVTLNLSSSAVSMTNNIINDSGFILTNQYYTGSLGQGTVFLNRNNIGGQNNQFIVSGSAPSPSSLVSMSDNFMFGGTNVIYIDVANARVTGSEAYTSALRNGLLGNQLIVSGSSFSADFSSFGSVFVGRYNVNDAIRNKTSDIVFAVGTGNATTRKTGFLIDSGSNSYFEGTLNVSGSTILSGSLYIQSGSTLPSATGSSILTWNPTTGQVSQSPIATLISSSFSVGAFNSTITQSGSAAVSQSMTFNNTDISNGVSIVSNSQITLANTGTYNIQFSAQLLAGTGADTIWIWLKKNGTNVSNTGTKLVLANNEASVAAWNFVVPAVASDYFELVWQSLDGHATLLTEVASGNYPAIPSIIVTVTQVE